MDTQSPGKPGAGMVTDVLIAARGLDSEPSPGTLEIRTLEKGLGVGMLGGTSWYPSTWGHVRDQDK